jgi:hypothetical protein
VLAKASTNRGGAIKASQFISNWIKFIHFYLDYIQAIAT